MIKTSDLNSIKNLLNSYFLLDKWKNIVDFLNNLRWTFKNFDKD